MKKNKKIFKPMLLILCAVLQMFYVLPATGLADNEADNDLNENSEVYEIKMPITSGDFEGDNSIWYMWTREPDTGTFIIDTETKKNGEKAGKLNYTGNKDWSLTNYSASYRVNEGEIYKVQAWVKVEGPGKMQLNAIASGDNGNVINWNYGAVTISSTNNEWQLVSTSFVINEGISKIVPRITGSGGPLTVWIDDFTVYKIESTGTKEDKSITNGIITVGLDSSSGVLTVYDERNGMEWKQKQLSGDFIIVSTRSNSHKIEVDLLNVITQKKIQMEIELEKDAPEFTFELIGDKDMEMPTKIQYPQPFVTEAGTTLIIPQSEGMSYPVEDPDISTRRLPAYQGSALSMTFWGVTDKDNAGGHMAIIETPDDAAISIKRDQGLLYIAPEWDAQKGKFGYNRKLRYVFFDEGGFVAIAKRYRQYVQEIGQFKTLEEKRKENPNVDLLVGAANIWFWDPGKAVSLAKEMRQAGFDRMLWSFAKIESLVDSLNAMGILTGRYDMYQDVMNPDNLDQIDLDESVPYRSAQYHKTAWPDDIVVGADGNYINGWSITGKDGKNYYYNVLCDRLALKYAIPRYEAEKEKNTARFIDTTTSTPWRECYSEEHPMTRTEGKEAKLELLRYFSEECGLVLGCEDGHSAAVPYLHYSEGIMSVTGGYRLSDAGYNMKKIYEEAPENVLKFQVGHEYRLPLWELVYHDCIVSYWYWGDYNNKITSIWKKRDLFNVLYGTPPMYMFDYTFWVQNRERFIESYETIAPVARDAGYSEMVDFRILTNDKSVQQSVFENGITVTVNFGDKPYTLPDGTVIEPMGYNVKYK